MANDDLTSPLTSASICENLGVTIASISDISGLPFTVDRWDAREMELTVTLGGTSFVIGNYWPDSHDAVMDLNRPLFEATGKGRRSIESFMAVFGIEDYSTAQKTHSLLEPLESEFERLMRTLAIERGLDLQADSMVRFVQQSNTPSS